MPPSLPDDLTRYAAAIGPQPDDVLEEMYDHADRTGFPIMGPETGGWLQLLARTVDAERVFEFGSGFGYSAYWFSRALPEHGEVVLTDADTDNLDAAREFLDRGGFVDRAVFEHGDAVETANEHDGPFDVVLVDLHKHQYVEAFEAIREKVAPGGLVVADNIVRGGPADFEDVFEFVVEDTTGDAPNGIAAYVERVRADEAFETTLLPLGSGVTVSYRVE